MRPTIVAAGPAQPRPARWLAAAAAVPATADGPHSPLRRHALTSRVGLATLAERDTMRYAVPGRCVSRMEHSRPASRPARRQTFDQVWTLRDGPRRGLMVMTP